MQSFGSQQWDTGFAIQALLTSNLVDEIGPTLARGHDFIKKSQVCFSILLPSFNLNNQAYLLTFSLLIKKKNIYIYIYIHTLTHMYPVFTQSNYCNFHENLKRSKTILLGTSKACTVTFPKDHGPSLIKIMDGKFLIALQKV